MGENGLCRDSVQSGGWESKFPEEQPQQRTGCTGEQILCMFISLMSRQEGEDEDFCSPPDTMGTLLLRTIFPWRWKRFSGIGIEEMGEW